MISGIRAVEDEREKHTEDRWAVETGSLEEREREVEKFFEAREFEENDE